MVSNVWVNGIVAVSIAALLVGFFTWRGMLLRAPTAPGTYQSPRADDSSDDLDDVLAQSFPASDPPSSTSGIARVRPAVRLTAFAQAARRA